MLKDVGFVCLVLCAVPVLTRIRPKVSKQDTRNSQDEPAHTTTEYTNPLKNASYLPDTKGTSRQHRASLHAEHTSADQNPDPKRQVPARSNRPLPVSYQQPPKQTVRVTHRTEDTEWTKRNAATNRQRDKEQPTSHKPSNPTEHRA
jgi:hypothetical protein